MLAELKAFAETNPDLLRQQRKSVIRDVFGWVE